MSLLELAEKYYKDGRIDRAATALRNYSFNNKPTNESRKLCKSLGKKLICSEEYESALELYESFNLVTEKENLKELITKLGEEVELKEKDENRDLISLLRQENHVPERLEKLKKIIESE